ncbi:prion-inhibition and propagation-domain-containing protein [Aspergillus unguis]
MPDEYRHCQVRLQMEQQRFLNFGLEAGVLYTERTLCETLRINRSLLLAVLAEIKTLLEHYATTNGKYVEQTPQAEIEWNDEGEPETDLVALLCLPSSGSAVGPSSDLNEKHKRSKQLRKVAKGIVQTGRNLLTITLEPKRLVWAAVDKASFDSLIARLTDLNSFLIALLDGSQIKRLQNTMDTSYNEILQIRDDIKSLTGLIKALSTDNEKGDELLGADATKGSPIRQLLLQETEAQVKMKRHLKKLAEVKIQYKRIDHLDTEPVSTDRKPLNLSQFIFGFQTPGDVFPKNHTLAIYEGRHVWIEWASYPSNQLKSDRLNTRPEDRIRLLIDLLCDEMPAGFLSPTTLGYVKSIGNEDETWFGIVFEKPPNFASAEVVTLHQLPHQPVPSLSARISLCAALAECIYTFHTVDWLHKGLRSEKVIFFSQQPFTVDLCTPYVLGYELSRPNILDELTEEPRFNPCEDIYRHPSAQSSQYSGNYRKSYDFYSFGILLIEIATWKPIQDFLGFANLASAKPSELLTVRRQLLEDRVLLQHISSIIGDSYKEIVVLCLRADESEIPTYDGESGTSIAVRLQRTLGQNVAKKLRDMERAIN